MAAKKSAVKKRAIRRVVSQSLFNSPVHKAKLKRTVESLIRASLELMADLPYDSEGYMRAEQIRESAGMLEDIVNGPL